MEREEGAELLVLFSSLLSKPKAECTRGTGVMK